MPDPGAVAAVLERVRREQPLVHVITNFVTMNAVADALRAFGARPVMAHAIEEVAEITAASRALVLNLGTPSTERLQAMRASGEHARACGIPVVLDPVGVGASQFRTAWALDFLAHTGAQVVRGNGGEIAALAGRRGAMSGVDGVIGDIDVATESRAVARAFTTTVAATGATSLVTDGLHACAIQNGHPFLPTITGTGDMASALIGACLAVERNAFIAAASGLIALGLAGERAGAAARGPGSFRAALLDALYGLTTQQVMDESRFSQE
ncbi:MAG: hydroxyethylthiazole kinase [Chloroflexi bacterium]|nr:hydroxyethylthiazole kinase [Chloroflexota bacterium]MCL5274505.1 hydroxyethylthiazole kinase [Chloroflexota bacterium]